MLMMHANAVLFSVTNRSTQTLVTRPGGLRLFRFFFSSSECVGVLCDGAVEFVSAQY